MAVQNRHDRRAAVVERGLRAVEAGIAVVERGHRVVAVLGKLRIAITLKKPIVSTMGFFFAAAKFVAAKGVATAVTLDLGRLWWFPRGPTMLVLTGYQFVLEMQPEDACGAWG